MTRFFSLLSFFIWATALASPFQVTIDPGHGGTDTGAVHHHLKEADLVLDVAKRLEKKLAGDTNFVVSLTRHQDHLVSLTERVKMATAQQAQLLVSLHANSSPEGRAKGMELFFQNSLPADEDSLLLASFENQGPDLLAKDVDSASESTRLGDIHAIVDDLKRNSRNKSSLKFSEMLSSQWKDSKGRSAIIKQAPFYVVSKATMPSVLVEIGFLTHVQEAQKLAQGSYRQEIAEKIYGAIVQYRERFLRLNLRQPALGQVEFQNDPR